MSEPRELCKAWLKSCCRDLVLEKKIHKHLSLSVLRWGIYQKLGPLSHISISLFTLQYFQTNLSSNWTNICTDKYLKIFVYHMRPSLLLGISGL